MAADDDDVVIDLEVTGEMRAIVSDQFRQQLPPDYEFDESSFIEFIMLLVANRRSKAQIRREMAPFVGDAAPALVNWLFSAMNAMKPPPPVVRPRLASVVLAPPASDLGPSEPAPRPPRKTPSTGHSSATRLLTNAAKDAVKSTSSVRPAPGGDQLRTSIGARRARFSTSDTARPPELRTRRSLGADPKRSRSPRGAVMDVEAKRAKAQVPQHLDRLLNRKLPAARSELLTSKSAAAAARPAGRRAGLLASDQLDRVLSRTLSLGPGQRDALNGTTFTVSLTHATTTTEAPPPPSSNTDDDVAVVVEPTVIFKAPEFAPPKAPEKAGGGSGGGLDVVPALPKKAVRCAFWPSCDKADQCVYVHPTQPCKYWPSCQFGDKCLYVHDKNLANVAIPCKFGTKCTRGADCKFSHWTAAASATTAATAPHDSEGQVKVCRYDMRCTKISCPFKHPEREKSEYFNDRLRDSHDDDDEDVTVVLSNTLPATPPLRSF